MRALLLVDLQNDFCPGGALAVPDGDQVMVPAMTLARCFDCVVASQDWHPADHGSFASQHEGHSPGDLIMLDGLEQVLWPEHCVAGSHGARFHPAVERALLKEVFRKGTDPLVDSYSAFHDNGNRRATGLGTWLRNRKVKELFVLGLALDYCVRFSALDAVAEGFRTRLVLDACRAVNLAPGDGDAAVAAMRSAGVSVCTSEEILGR